MSSHTFARRGLLLGGLGMVVAGCGSSAGQPPGPDNPTDVTLTFMNFGPFTKALPQTLGKPFTERTGVTVQLNNVGEQTYEAVDQRVQAGLVAGNPPDIAMIGLNSVRTYAEAELAEPLDQLMNENSPFRRDDYYPAFLDLCKRGDSTVALPYGVSVLVLYYNADHFRAAGLNPDKPPETLTALREAAQRIVSSGTARYGVNLSTDSSGLFSYQSMILSNGGSLMNADETALTLTEPGVRDVIQFWTDIAADGLGDPMNRKQEQEAFLRGDLAMFFQTNAAIVGLTSTQPNFEIRATPVPVPDGGQRRVPAAGAALVILNDDADKRAAAWLAVTELTSAAGATSLVKASGYLSPNRVAAESEQHLKPFVRDNATMRIALEQAENLVPWYQFPGRHSAEIMTLITEEFLAARRRSKTVDKALADATRRAEALLS